MISYIFNAIWIRFKELSSSGDDLAGSDGADTPEEQEEEEKKVREKNLALYLKVLGMDNIYVGYVA